MSDFRELVSNYIRTRASTLEGGSPPKSICEETLSSNRILSYISADFVRNGVRSALEEIYHGNKEFVQNMLDKYLARKLVEADGLLDKLALIGTPEYGQGRISALIGLLELNKDVQGIFMKESLIEKMSNHWTQIPIFYEDLHQVFDIIQRLYSNHPRTQAFANWYQFRDGILEVSGELLRAYGSLYNEVDHRGCFGVRSHAERLALPGVSTLEFITVLCSANLEVARSGHRKNMVNAHYVKGGKVSWKKALELARNWTIKEG